MAVHTKFIKVNTLPLAVTSGGQAGKTVRCVSENSCATHHFTLDPNAGSVFIPRCAVQQSWLTRKLWSLGGAYDGFPAPDRRSTMSQKPRTTAPARPAPPARVATRPAP